MSQPSLPPDERRRVAALRALGILDTPTEERFDRITRLAARVFAVPMAAVSLVDERRQWIKSQVGVAVCEIPRDLSFCAHAIAEDETLVVADTRLDPRFAGNPMVTGAPCVRFYAGQPLHALDGSRIGALCIADVKPRQMAPGDLETLRDLGAWAEREANAAWLDQADASEGKQAEDAVVELAAIVESSNDAIIGKTLDGIIRSWNTAAERLYGYAAEEVRGRPISIVVTPDRAAETLAILGRIARGERVEHHETVRVRKDGTRVDVSLTVSPVRNAEGEIVGASAIARDMTERRRAEAALHETLDRLQATLRAVPDLMFEVDAGGRIQSCHAPQEQALYAPPEVFLGRRIDEVLPGEASRIITRALQEAAETGHHHGAVYSLDVPDGRRWFELSAARKGERSDAEPQFVVTVRDITQRVLAEEHLCLQAAALEAADNAIMITGGDGTIQWANPAFTRLTGYSPEEVVGQTPRLLKSGCQGAAFYREMWETILAGRSWRGELTNRHKDGHHYAEEMTVTPVRDAQGQVTHFIAIKQDISERKAIDRMKNEFISTVSHELRTPLTSIRGALGLVEGGVVGELPAQARSLVSIALNNSDRLVRLINDILDIEKIESGRMEFRMRPVAIAPLVRSALEANEAYARQFGVSIALEDEAAGARVLGDDDRLSQVMANLISNAAKFSPHGGVVTVGIAQLHHAVRVSVSDRGPGIPDGFREQVFQKFAQADASDSRQKGGTGLGLSISKAIIDRHGGQIGFETETGAGTTFFFDLPVWQEIPAARPEPRPSARPRILVVEDDADVANLLRMMLDQAGFEADTAYDAEQAKAALARTPYAAMTVDILLPGQDGLSLIRELRTQEYTQYLPVVVVSVVASTGRQLLNGDALAVVDWLEKPIDQDRLAAALRDAVRARSGRRPLILHIEDDADILSLVSMILEDVADVVPAADLGTARDWLSRERYDLVLLDLALADGSGLEILPLLHRHGEPTTPVVIFSAREVEPQLVREVAATLVKSRTTNAELLETITSVIRNGC
ncbi:MAG: PAS domain S-box protein [Armatimonadetes bacterium]|nr:PAS domain S-box protein [Armatimonadota bacterium]